MSLEVETIVAVSVMMAVFSAVAAVGTSIVLGAGFERLRCGFEVIRKQTGFFSDAIHKLEEKMEVVDDQTGKFSRAIEVMEQKVTNVGEQANAFNGSIEKLEQKVEIVDKQAGFFGDAIHRLEKRVDEVDTHGEVLTERIASQSDADLISIGKTEAMVSHAEELLMQMGDLASKLSVQASKDDASLQSYSQHAHMPATGSQGFH